MTDSANIAAEGTLSDLLREGGRMMVYYKGLRIPVDYRKGSSSDKVVFLFHGALRRNVREIPFFQGFLPSFPEAHQFSVSDPTMLTTQIITTSWYCGAQNENLQAILRDFFADIQQYLNADRRIYVGASSGGFAALLYSYFDAGSVAVPSIPQTSLKEHFKLPVGRFLDECWPDCENVEVLDEKGIFDLPAAYAKGFGNLVIYIQSTGDRYHMSHHFTPFISAIGHDVEKLICDVGFWDKLGHAAAVPLSAVVPWIEAALTSPSLDANDVLATRFKLLDPETLAQIGAGARKRGTSVGAANRGPSLADIKLSDKVRDYFLIGT